MRVEAQLAWDSLFVFWDHFYSAMAGRGSLEVGLLGLTSVVVRGDVIASTKQRVLD